MSRVALLSCLLLTVLLLAGEPLPNEVIGNLPLNNTDSTSAGFGFPGASWACGFRMTNTRNFTGCTLRMGLSTAQSMRIRVSLQRDKGNDANGKPTGPNGIELAVMSAPSSPLQFTKGVTTFQDVQFTYGGPVVPMYAGATYWIVPCNPYGYAHSDGRYNWSHGVPPRLPVGADATYINCFATDKVYATKVYIPEYNAKGEQLFYYLPWKKHNAEFGIRVFGN